MEHRCPASLHSPPPSPFYFVHPRPVSGAGSEDLEFGFGPLSAAEQHAAGLHLRRCPPPPPVQLANMARMQENPYYAAFGGILCFQSYDGIPKKIRSAVQIAWMVNLLKTKLGFDEAFNYKKEKDLNTALKRYFPQGIDIYFENVGGATLDAVVLNMRQYGQIPLCRMISQYYLEQPEGVRQLAQAIIRRVRMEGFLVFDYFGQYRKFEEEMAGYLKECKICYIKDIACGLEKAPAALIGLFSGRNVGKQLVALDLE
ncbi:hypothetical protein U9M48_035552 [Paspalum notatum var. saurae]|uniref:Alcohol dehydrogenase-like C-terminal domain-containing protein n=1 Tax=Paspalum notatum var. saurae TaxID=547442 RepID=A0AAQ3X7T7_PASNO